MRLLVGEKMLGDGYRDATDAEIMAAARVIVDKRLNGDMSMFVSTTLHELNRAFGWCDENGYPNSPVYVQFDGHWKTP